jgi:hypothetical protein
MTRGAGAAEEGQAEVLPGFTVHGMYIGKRPARPIHAWNSVRSMA